MDKTQEAVKEPKGSIRATTEENSLFNEQPTTQKKQLYSKNVAGENKSTQGEKEKRENRSHDKSPKSPSPRKKYTAKLRRRNSADSDATSKSTDSYSTNSSRTEDSTSTRSTARKRGRTQAQEDELVDAQLHILKRMKEVKEYHKDKHGRRGAICIGGDSMVDALTESLQGS